MKRVSGGVSGPGRKLSVCSMLKEEMEASEGAGRGTHTTAEEDRRRILTLKFKGTVGLFAFSVKSFLILIV